MAFSTFILAFFAIFSVLVTFGDANLMNFPSSFRRGFFRKYSLQKRTFAPDSGFLDLDLEVSFNFSTECDYPELPSWLRLEQRQSLAPAFLYGAPEQWSESTKIEVIGWDKDTYKTVKKIQEIHITNDDFPYYQAEFFIKNKTLDKFLAGGDDEKIARIVSNYWSPSDLGLTMVISAIGHGGRIPLPNSNNYEGVIVRVGSSQMWPQGNDSALQPGKEPSQDYFKNEGFEINWSLFKWVDLREVKSPEAQRQALLPVDNMVKAVAYSPPALDDSERDFGIDIYLVVVIPIIVILLLVLLLSIIMCCGREGKRKRDQATPHIKLTHHHNIQRSTLRLRELSKPQDGSAQHPGSEDPSRPRHAHGGEYSRLDDEDDERPDGRNAPPPYRMPPGSAGKGPSQAV